MTSSALNFSLTLPRRMRSVLALIVLTIFLFGGVLHGLRDLDVTISSKGSVISLTKKGLGHSEKGVIADHHCHGCFSVSVPAPVIGAIEEMPAVKIVAAIDVGHRVLQPGIDPPPPKLLT